MNEKLKTSEAQRRASIKYKKANRDYLRIREHRSKGIKFIRENSKI